MTYTITTAKSQTQCPYCHGDIKPGDPVARFSEGVEYHIACGKDREEENAVNESERCELDYLNNQ